MKTAAAITALAVVGSFALGQGARLPVASDSPSSPASNLPPMHGLSVRPTGDLPAPHGSLQLGADCPPVEVEEWFAPTPHLVECSIHQFPRAIPYPWVNSLTCAEPGIADVNGDGTSDHFDDPSEVTGGIPIAVVNGQVGFPPGTDSIDLTANAVNQAGTSTRISLTRIPLIRAGFGDWITTHLPPIPDNEGQVLVFLRFPTPSGQSQRAGWRDMDADGDLDYVCTFWVYRFSGTQDILGGQLWFENIGYEKAPPPLAADLNRDGAVDGVDLGLLLAAWGTNS